MAGNPCPECRFTNGSCRRFVIGHPDPVCVAGYPQQHPAVDEFDGLDSHTKETESKPTTDQPAADLRFADEATFGRIGIYRHSIPAPRRSPENIGVR